MIDHDLYQALEDIKTLANITEDIDLWDSEGKECIKCNKYLKYDSFYNIKRSKDGKDYYCKDCRNDSTIESHFSRKDTPCSVEDCLKPHYAKSYCRTHYERVRKNGTTEARKAKNPELSRYVTALKYSVDLEWYQEKLQGACDCCGEKEKDVVLYIDHDHNCCNGDTTKYPVSCGDCVRGIVCPKCNSAIGHYDNGTIRKNNPLLPVIKEYINKYERA